MAALPRDEALPAIQLEIAAACVDEEKEHDGSRREKSNDLERRQHREHREKQQQEALILLLRQTRQENIDERDEQGENDIARDKPVPAKEDGK